MQPSYVHETSEEPLIGETVDGVLARAAVRWPQNDDLIVCHQGVRWSYAELDARVDRLSAGLAGLGLQPGERIGILSPNNAEWVLTQFASARAARRVAESGLMSLEAPIQRVAGYDTAMPLPRLERHYMPTSERIAAAARRALDYA